MRTNNNFNPTTPLLTAMLIAIGLLIIAIIMLVFRNQGGGETVQAQPTVNEGGIVQTAIAGLSLTQTALPTNTPLPTATSTPTLPPTATPVPPTATPTEVPPTETPLPTATVAETVASEVPEEGEAPVEEESGGEVDTENTESIDASETITATEESPGIASEPLITPTVSGLDPALCTAGPLISDNGCTYNIEVGFSVFNPDTGIHDFYLSNVGTCDIPANHKMVQITDELTTKTFETEYVIGGEFFPVGQAPDPNYVENGTDEPPFVFLNYFIPEASGTYESCWRLTDENNNFYGAPLITTVVVE